MAEAISSTPGRAVARRRADIGKMLEVARCDACACHPYLATLGAGVLANAFSLHTATPTCLLYGVSVNGRRVLREKHSPRACP